MDSFLDSSDIGLCLSDMVDGDLKYSLELGLELTPYCGLGSGRSSPLLLPSVTELYSCCTTDPLDPGILVDPAAVVPRRQTETDTPSTVRVRRHSRLREEHFLLDNLDSDEDEEVEKPVVKREEVKTVVTPRPIAPPKVLVPPASAPVPPPVTTRPSITTWPSQVSSTNGHHGGSTVGKATVGRGSRNEVQVESPPPSRPRQPRPPPVPAHHTEYPKPSYSYSCLIAMALKNSPSGSLPVSEIYKFMCEHFPFFESAAPCWKNSVRHNLSLGKSFKKIEKSSHGGSRKGCLWTLNPSNASKMDEEMAKCSMKDPLTIKRAMKRPETLDRLERGDMKIQLKNLPVVATSSTEDEEDEEVEEVEEEEEDEEEEEEEEEVVEEEEEIVEEEDDEEHAQPSDDEPSDDEGEVPPSLKPFDPPIYHSNRTNLTNDIGVEFPEEVYEELGVLEEVLEEEAENSMYVPVKRSRLDYSYRQAITSHQ